MQNNISENQEETPEPIPEMEDPTYTETESYQVPPEDVMAFTEMRSCRDLVSMVSEGILDLHPEYQRNFIWKDADQTRFIDSLIKRFPIPSMCFAFEYKTDTWSVIDGLQRISTIIRFLEKSERPWRLSRADNIDPEIRGKTPTQLQETHGYISRVENTSLPVTVLRCDLSKPEHAEYLVMIFHRLNTGGLRLNNQEIRNCIFGGKLNELLKELDLTPEWRQLNRMKSDDNNYRLVKQDLMLRFFAFYDQKADQYKARMSPYLDDYMRENRNCSDEKLHDMRKIFTQVVAIFSKMFNDKEPQNAIPTNVHYPAMVGIARNIEFLNSLQPTELRRRFDSLQTHEAFQDNSGLAEEKVVTRRLEAATQIFGEKNVS